MKKVLKITLVLIVIFMNMAQFSMVYARQAEGTTASEKTKSGTIGGTALNPEEWNPSAYRDTSEEAELDARAKIITTTIRSIGIVVSVITLMVIGIREMTASAEEKSIIKQSMPGYVIGAIMVFAMTVIPTLIYEWAKDL